jgi:hypothetical protein
MEVREESEMHVPWFHLPRHHAARPSRVRERAAGRPERSEEEHGAHVTRAFAALVLLAGTLFGALWTLASLGYADAGWWPAVVIGAMVAVAALGAWLASWLDR